MGGVRSAGCMRSWLVWVKFRLGWRVVGVHKTLAWVRKMAWIEFLAWVHNILARVKMKMAWVEILVWFANSTWVQIPCYLIILYRKHCVLYRMWFNCTNQIQQALQLLLWYLTYFVLFLSKWNWHMRDAFLDLFSSLYSFVFFLNCGYLFSLKCKTMKINKRRREKRERKYYINKSTYNITTGFSDKESNLIWYF